MVLKASRDPGERKAQNLQRRLEHFQARYREAGTKRKKYVAEKQIARVEIDIKRHKG